MKISSEDKRLKDILILNTNLNPNILLVVRRVPPHKLLLVNSTLRSPAPPKVLLLDLDLSSLGLGDRSSVVFIRRRKDTNGDRDTGVKVQIADLGVCSSSCLCKTSSSHKSEGLVGGESVWQRHSSCGIVSLLQFSRQEQNARTNKLV